MNFVSKKVAKKEVWMSLDTAELYIVHEHIRAWTIWVEDKFGYRQICWKHLFGRMCENLGKL